MKNAFLLSALFAATLLAACSSTETSKSKVDLAPGTYQNSTRSVDANGTEVKKQTSTSVYVDEDGNKKAVVDSKVTKDPRGLFNKTTSESHEVVQ